jgi:hypothetical protein
MKRSAHRRILLKLVSLLHAHARAQTRSAALTVYDIAVEGLSQLSERAVAALFAQQLGRWLQRGASSMVPAARQERGPQQQPRH